MGPLALALVGVLALVALLAPGIYRSELRQHPPRIRTERARVVWCYPEALAEALWPRAHFSSVLPSSLR